MEFHEKLQVFRKSKKKTQAEFSKALGVNIRTYQRWERGEIKTSLVKFTAIMNILQEMGFEYHDFIGNSEKVVIDKSVYDELLKQSERYKQLKAMLKEIVQE